MLEKLLINAIAERNLLEKHIPIIKTLMAFDVLTMICLHTIIKDPLNYKRLILSLPYSQNGIRKQLFKLIDAGYILEKKSESDTRVRLLIASDSTIESISNYLHKKFLFNKALFDLQALN